MEIVNKFSSTIKPRVALFDFDGTISTLRQGWENVMEPMMLEMICGGTPATPEIVQEIRTYIDESTGIQTIYQMQWLADAVRKFGRNKNVVDDPWWYKGEYNKRLMNLVDDRKNALTGGEKKPEDFMIKGSKNFLEALRCLGVDLYVASGTDHQDVAAEVETLGLKDYFTEIAGAPAGRADCSKEAVLRRLVSQNNLAGEEVVVIGDGKVEIALGREVGAKTLGIASDEIRRCGINPQKQKRLKKAGAHAITGDFTDLNQIINWMFGGIANGR